MDDAILVYDARPEGHRASYVEVFGRLLGARTAIAPLGRAWRALLSAPYLVLPTFETRPAAYTAVVLARTLARRRTCIVFLRAHVRRGGQHPWQLLRRAWHYLASANPAVLPLSITPMPAGSRSAIRRIEDPQFWDLDDRLHRPPETDVSLAVREAAAGREILLVTGTLEASKGLGLLAAMWDRQPRLGRRFCLVMAGQPVAMSQEQLAAWRARAGLLVDRFLTEDEIMSLYAVADAAWCCYAPSYDQSSGIFGRAVQFGIPTVVRRGSLLDAFQQEIGSGVALDHDRPDESADALAAMPAARAAPRSRWAYGRDVVAPMIRAHIARATG